MTQESDLQLAQSLTRLTIYPLATVMMLIILAATANNYESEGFLVGFRATVVLPVIGRPLIKQATAANYCKMIQPLTRC